MLIRLQLNVPLIVISQRQQLQTVGFCVKYHANLDEMLNGASAFPYIFTHFAYMSNEVLEKCYSRRLIIFSPLLPNLLIFLIPKQKELIAKIDCFESKYGTLMFSVERR